MPASPIGPVAPLPALLDSPPVLVEPPLSTEPPCSPALPASPMLGWRSVLVTELPELPVESFVRPSDKRSSVQLNALAKLSTRVAPKVTERG
jgi:hypothetical protein